MPMGGRYVLPIMNKRQKILTIVALALFGAIIFVHYNSIDYAGAYQEVQYFRDKTAPDKYVSTDPNAGLPDKGKFDPSTAKPVEFDDLIPQDKPPKKRMPADEFRNKNTFNARKGGEFVTVEYPGSGLYLSGFPGIKDVRMPLFVLAVFYAGLFFILADPRAKSPKS